MRSAGAVDIGGTATKIGIVAEDGSVLARSTITTSAEGGPPALVHRMVTTLRPMLDTAATGGRPVFGLGVSVAGFLDADHTAMYGNANLPWLCGFPLRDALEERLALGCRLEVDTNASTVAEYRYGAGRGSARLLGITVGTGVGGGVMVQGRLLRYNGECAGDVGHVILDPKGRQCTCGARGCFEAMVCSAAVSERAAGRPVPDVVRSARTGDRAAREALAETGWWLGLGLASLAPLFAPGRIVVGGGVAAAGELLLEPARASYQEHAATDQKQVGIVGSSFEGWEGMVGAGSLLLDPLF